MRILKRACLRCWTGSFFLRGKRTYRKTARILCRGRCGAVRRCMGRRNTGAFILIAAGVVLLIFALPLRFWAAAIGSILIAAGIVILLIDR